MQTESKTQAGVKCRLSINCRRGLVERFKKGKPPPPPKKNTCNRTLLAYLTTSPSQIHSFLLWNVVDDPKTWSQSWTFFKPHATTLDAKFSILHDQGPWIGTAPQCLCLSESCWPKILYRKNYSDKKGSNNHSNNKERCCAGNLDDLLWKYCKSRYADLSCSDVHWNFWRMCNALRLGSEVCNWYRLAISPIWRRRSTNV